MNTKTSSVAVAFLASDVNRFSINALTGAIEQDPDLQVTLSFPHPRSATTCHAEIEQLVQSVGPSGRDRGFQLYELGAGHNDAVVTPIARRAGQPTPSTALCCWRSSRIRGRSRHARHGI